MIQLIIPSTEFKKSFLTALTEYHAEGLHTELDPGSLERDFNGYINQLALKARGEGLPADRVQSSTFWLIDQDHYIGRLSIRHSLNDYLLQFGGHIGYDIRPSMRNRGYGTQILALAIPEAKKIGLSRALVTCKTENSASQKIIEKNGGVLEDIRYCQKKNCSYRRYWIDL
jgi:predicted acetyltransferase